MSNILLLITDLDSSWGKWSASRPGLTSGTHWIGGWVGHRGSLDTEARGKILCLCRGSNPDRPVCKDAEGSGRGLI
jgi:hypothetical protein